MSKRAGSHLMFDACLVITITIHDVVKLINPINNVRLLKAVVFDTINFVPFYGTCDVRIVIR